MSATDSDLLKAHIQLLDRDHEEDGIIPVLFNPAEYNLSKQVTYGDQQLAGMTSPLTQFVGGQAETLSMELFFDTSEGGGDVRDHTSLLDELVSVDSDRHAPPICRFVWGTLVFTAVVEQLDKRFTMFRAGGIPVRARVDVTFREYAIPDDQRKNAVQSPADKTTVWLVTEGDTLWAIAAEEYGDPYKWRLIAEQNGVDNPRALMPGTELEIPPL